VSALDDVLVIDDEPERLSQICSALEEELGGSVGIVPWRPAKDEDPLAAFSAQIASGVGLVVTDDDLTRSQLGLLGSAITSWAQDRFLPVCNFSRQPQRKLPHERDFFELRVPDIGDDAERAKFIARMYHGFNALRRHVEDTPDATPTPSLLADAIGHPQMRDELAPFITSVGSANSWLRQAVVGDVAAVEGMGRVNFLAFLLGHVMVNAVLEYPGPILGREPLAAYCALDKSIAGELAGLFQAAAYDGPFSAPGMYFVRREVDRRIDELAASAPAADADESDQYSRQIVEKAIGHGAPHDCPRCDGLRGGLWCPFTQRAVCNREDCSVASNGWLPRGSTLCRVERDHFDKWSPLLGE
jgi:hypothetical protein